MAGRLRCHYYSNWSPYDPIPPPTFADVIKNATSSHRGAATAVGIPQQLQIVGPYEPCILCVIAYCAAGKLRAWLTNGFLPILIPDTNIFTGPLTTHRNGDW